VRGFGSFRPVRKLMSTALLYCGTPEGFVIGADSRGTNPVTGQIDDKERKLFAFENQLVSVVFAWAGIVKARAPLFDVSLIEETTRILPVVDYQVFDQDFNARLRERLSVLRVNTTGDVAHGIFLYFWRGISMICQISVFKNGQTWDSRVIEGGTPNGEIDIISGPDATFEKPVSLNQARNMIEHYIRSAVDDPERPDIGGYPHIGKLTSEGFDWLIPFVGQS